MLKEHPAQDDQTLPPAPPAWNARHPRWTALLLALGGWALIAVSASLRPDSRGYDTHTQLDLPPCSFIQTTGLPCPACGMTTAFANMAHARPLAAVRAQACGAALFVLTAVVTVLATAQWLTGRPHLAQLRPKMWWLWVLLAALALGWGIKLAIGFSGGTLPVR